MKQNQFLYHDNIIIVQSIIIASAFYECIRRLSVYTSISNVEPQTMS
jgi:hypothetical protein